MRNIILSISIVIVSGLVFAGGGNSSGGGVSFEAQELGPWFLGAERVGYCIEKNDQAFPQDNKEIALLIHEIVEFWHSELAVVTWQFTNKVEFLDKSQRTSFLPSFDYVDRCDHPEAHLHFALGTLPDGLRALMGEPKRFFAGAFRLPELKGTSKGYIYLANPYSAEAPEQLRERNWHSQMTKDATYFELALVHELGHVFGVRHRDQTVMGETTLDTVARFINSSEKDLDSPTSLVHPEQKTTWRYLSAGIFAPQNEMVVYRFFGYQQRALYTALTGLAFVDKSEDVPDYSLNWVKVEVCPYASETLAYVYAQQSVAHPWQLVGSISKKKVTLKEIFPPLLVVPASPLWIIHEHQGSDIFGGAAFSPLEINISGSFILTSQEQGFPVFVRLRPDGHKIQIMGVVDDTLLELWP